MQGTPPDTAVTPLPGEDAFTGCDASAQIQLVPAQQILKALAGWLLTGMLATSLVAARQAA